ncbi:MAG: hypothetical protein AUG00_02010 [Candidatus Rokubacteria bacterium 13_1_20CM_2_70_7]|nr:MAG: hypothetical protein AUG00_02010 [Candidatus Rokubacteria bacterium 13_1_20CM_2_70_7]
MRWLIDGYNVIRRDPDLRASEAQGLEAGRKALLSLIAGIARRSADRFTVVFDGAPIPGPATAGGQLEVIFSRPPQKADDILVALARQEGDGAVVVTSDRAIQDAAHRARCAVLGVDEFLAGLMAPGEEAGRGEKDGEDEEARAQPKRGNPRRLSKEARAAQRALRRLRPR